MAERKMTLCTIGIDISKDHLDAHRLSDGASRRFSNTKAGHKALRTWLGKAGPSAARIVYEPTGPCHRALERGLAAAGYGLIKVNPLRARRFAEVTGKLTKTDRMDAALLTRIGAVMELETHRVRSPVLNDLKDLSTARETLVKARTAIKNRA